ncbi:MAG: hypothetical protein JST12_08650 [Armatimonadetes bacterium]|nr:hypothetical protein [Armatimonadota bacterium]MBS1701717.1 hypothetical protein [Armatimonadota bacterium]
MKRFLTMVLLASCIAAAMVGCGDKSDVPIAQPTTTGPGGSSNGERPGTPGGPPATPDAHLEKKGGASGQAGSRPGS